MWHLSKEAFVVIGLSMMVIPASSAERQVVDVTACIEFDANRALIHWSVRNLTDRDITVLEEVMPWAPSEWGAKLMWSGSKAPRQVAPMGSGRNSITIPTGKTVTGRTDLHNYLDNAGAKLREENATIDWSYRFPSMGGVERFSGALSRQDLCKPR